VLDFYAAAQRVCVEADGGQHFHGDEERRDVERDGYLAARGIRVLRFSNADIVSRRDSVMAAILEALGTPSP
jgi:very-short-patch-repair endonuclease